MHSQLTDNSAASSSTRAHTHSAITFTNIRGLNRNIDSAHHYLQSLSPLILFLTETQLSPSSDRTHLQFPNYTLYSSFIFKAGVCAFVHDSAKITHLSDLDVSNREFQFLWLKLRVSSSNLYFCILYRSPNSSDCSVSDLLSSRIENILQSDSTAQVTILGDFNVHNSDWLTHSASTTTLGREAEAFAVINNLSQLVTFPTRVPDRSEEHAHTLDLLLTSNPSLISDLSHSPPLGSSDHCLITFSVQIPTYVPTQPSRRTFWRYESADWCGFRDFLASYPWRDCVFSSNPSTSAVNVVETILQGMHMFIPHFSKPGKQNSPEWFTHECSRAVRRKKVAFRRWCLSPNPSSHHCYVQARNKCSSVIQKVKDKFVRRKADKLATCPSGSRSFWSLAKAVSRNFCPSSFPPITNSSGDLVSDPSLKAEVFASLFASNSTLPLSTAVSPTATHHALHFIPI
ncbi:hypothetical protein H7673_10630 [Streptococcus dysgalactiae subsp. equisimilis]|nr:hypothetical protein [Streptococcus dysgalactiae subsp. equisimilis]